MTMKTAMCHSGFAHVEGSQEERRGDDDGRRRGSTWYLNRPVAATIWPPMMLVTSRPRTAAWRSGRKVAEAPRAVWMKVGRYWMAPNMPAPRQTTIRFVWTNTRLRKIASGKIACGWRRSWKTNATRKAAAARTGRWSRRRPSRTPRCAQTSASSSGDRRAREQGRAEEVDAARACRPLRANGRLRQMKKTASAPSGHVDVEAPAPAGVVGEEAADGRAGDGGKAEGPGEEADVLGALGGREDVAEDGEDAGHDHAAADALDAAGDDQPDHRGRGAAGGGAGDEDGDADEDEGLRPNMSESLPTIGTTTVELSM